MLRAFRHGIYNGELIIDRSTRQFIAQESGLNDRHIQRIIKDYTSAELLKRIAKGRYMFNQDMFARGSINAIMELRERFAELNSSKLREEH